MQFVGINATHLLMIHSSVSVFFLHRGKEGRKEKKTGGKEGRKKGKGRVGRKRKPVSCLHFSLGHSYLCKVK